MKAIATYVKGDTWEVPLKGSFRWSGAEDGMYRVLTDTETVEFNLANLLYVRLVFSKGGGEEPPRKV